MIYAIITILSFVLMEGVAWVTHKYVMHGLLWSLHRDHHQKEPDQFFEKNDYFFLIFAIPGIISLGIGNYVAGLETLFYLGLGITIYGFAYFMVHDIFIHQRFRLFTRTNNVYLRAIRKAHKMHHKHLGKEHGECFGMLWVPAKYFIEAMKSGKQHA